MGQITPVDNLGKDLFYKNEKEWIFFNEEGVSFPGCIEQWTVCGCSFENNHVDCKNYGTELSPLAQQTKRNGYVQIITGGICSSNDRHQTILYAKCDKLAKIESYEKFSECVSTLKVTSPSACQVPVDQEANDLFQLYINAVISGKSSNISVPFTFYLDSAHFSLSITGQETSIVNHFKGDIIYAFSNITGKQMDTNLKVNSDDLNMKVKYENLVIGKENMASIICILIVNCIVLIGIVYQIIHSYIIQRKITKFTLAGMNLNLNGRGKKIN
ncbi:hypothetical protein M0812_02780 [Anaeramoeba flamelloides]|uniref:Uncharacterized protein n=1 Tax=Anaeramoeba flamelloides TaxID=1746091 RepID=A0AAV7YQQ2_9EUKA|nr:hypothetical protein M0812_02780 [Anaeramoeba flamelloides]